MNKLSEVTARPTPAGPGPAALPIDKGGPDKDSPDGQNFSGRQLALGLLFGLAFGFLLQKGGVAKYHVLVGVLLLEDFTVIKVMLSAIIVGMVGVFTLYALGLVKLHVKPTRYAANLIGGLLFGVGFALLGYCPGTGRRRSARGTTTRSLASWASWPGRTSTRSHRACLAGPS